MGNQLANESGTKGPTTTFGRRGALGLSKAELEKRCQPSGLYPSCHWEEKAIRRLIGDGRLAARLKGTETRKSVTDQECPICFLHYSQINVTQCCKANICTECFLQVRPQKEKHSVCPFCNNPKMYVVIAKRLDANEIQEREQKEQQMIEATIRARAEGPAALPATEGFGASLENNDIVRRARSRTMSEDGTTTPNNSAQSANNDVQLLRQLSLSSEDRQALEAEMRAQHTHPLALQMEAEAAERRIANEREYYRNNPTRSREAALLRAMGSSGSSLRNHLPRTNSGDYGMPSRRRNWNEIVDAFERGGNGEVTSLDDLVVLEAAILLSMEEEARNRYTRSGSFSAPQHAEQGFPLVQQYLNSRSGARGYRPPSGRAASVINPSLPRMYSRELTEEEQVAMAIALSMQEENKKKDEEPAGKADDNNNEDKGDDIPKKDEVVSKAGEVKSSDVTSNFASGTSAKPASAPASMGIAARPKEGHNEDEEEEVAFADMENTRNEFMGKSSDDDSTYFRMLEKVQADAPRPMKEIADVPLAVETLKTASDEQGEEAEETDE